MGRLALPLFPLATVLFPGLVLPLHVFEERYRALVRHLTALPADQRREFGVVAIKRGWEVEQGVPGVVGVKSSRAALILHEVGCTAELREVTERPDGRFDLVTVGRRRFRLVKVDAAAAPYLVAEVEYLNEEVGDQALADRLTPRVLAAFQRYLAMLRPATPTGEQLPDDPTVLSHLVAASAVLPLSERQRLLAEPNTVSRLRAELATLNREMALLRRLPAVPVPLADLAVPTSLN